MQIFDQANTGSNREANLKLSMQAGSLLSHAPVGGGSSAALPSTIKRPSSFHLFLHDLHNRLQESAMAHQYFAPQPARRNPALYREPASPIAHEEELGLICDFEQSIFIFPNPTMTSKAKDGLSIRTDVGRDDTKASAAPSTTRRGRRLSSATESTNWELLSARSASIDTALHSPLGELWETTDEEEGSLNIMQQPPSVASTVRNDSPQLAQPAPEQSPRYALGKQPYPNAFTYADGHFQLRRRASVSRSRRSRRRNESRSRCRTGYDRRRSASLPRIPAHATPPSYHRLPLLPILSALFGIEDTTLKLLASPTNANAPSLFPGPRLHRPEVTSDEKRVKPLEASEIATLKHGVDATIDSSLRSDNAFALPSFPFPSVWSLVNGMRKAPRKAQIVQP